ncbi:uncharacterized protein LOC130828586 [Amaranthus tricolor]|uniref:uncharacterized protein LOC130828586 n=1 Tax=Amaranthus tricolor TaxID=29722 RepID=UPI0025873062|nr:uncharacterized protein LOC130828586 [Amaranthus tricolor]
MLSLKVSDSLPHGTFKRIAQKYGYTHRTIRDLWKRAIQTKEANKPYIVEPKYKNCGRKRVVVPPNLLESKPIGECTCIRDVATCLDLALSTVWRLIKRGEIKAHSNPLHPALTDANKIRRAEWILSLIQEDTIQRHPIYKVMYDYIHIDKKWFYLTKKTQRVYLAHKEMVPYRAAKSSKFITKAMFLWAVARPRWDRFGQYTFDGKIGICPFINMVAAQRDSKNRPRGSIEIKPTESVNQEVHRSMLIQQLIPAILRKWPSEGPSIIFIQQDNARVHITNDDPIWQQHNRQGAVEDAFRELHPKTLTNVWISLQHHLNEILKVKGSNDYIQPHFGKKVEKHNGRLRIQVRIPTQLVREAVAFLNPNRDQQQTQALTENEDAAQTTEIIQEAYD